MNNYYKISCLENNTELEKSVLKEGESLKIGRNTANDLVLKNKLISSQHCVLEVKNGALCIIDSHSKNGTFINNVRLEAGVSVHIDTDNIVTLTNDSIKIKIEKKLLSITIGRSQECDIILQDNSVSRQHATIRPIGNNQHELIDHNSTNGTYVNGQRISTITLKENDSFIIGRNLFRPDGTYKPLSDQIVVQLKNASKTYPNGSTAIQPLSFSIQPRTLTAIMGPSGCGKSTLLKMILGLSTHTGGTVSLFGFDLITYFNVFKQYIGYVPQDDVVHEELTVFQAIYFSAKIRLHDKSEEYRLNKISNLLEQLNINFIKNNLISEISGGQRKRLSIAIELLTDPILLLLDEPTSPLDPQSIEEFMSILKKLVRNGTTVMMVTHKPEDLDYMDEVIFLAEGGHFAYKGSTKDYLSHFNSSSTIAVYSQLSGKTADQWKQNSTVVTHDIHILHHTLEYKKVNWFNQLYWLTMRNLKIKINDHLNSSIIFLQAPIIALLIGFIFSELTLSVLFMMVVSSIWFGVNNASREIVKEQNIYKRENLFNVLPSTYLLSKVIILLITALIQTALFIATLKIMYSSTETKLENSIDAAFWLISINLASAILGLLLSAAMKTTDKVLSLVPLVLIPQIMLAGVITPINIKAVEILSYFTFSRWGVEGLTHIQQRVTSTQVATIIDPSSLQKTISTTNEIQSSLPMIQNQYHSLYSDIFSSLSGTFLLDMIQLSFIGFSMLLFTYIFIKRKSA